MNYYLPITELNEDQKAFLQWYSLSIRIPDDAKDLEEFYLYLLNKRRKWFKAKNLLRKLPKGLKLDADSEKDLRGIIREHGGDEHLELFICGTIEAVYEGAEEWRNKYEVDTRKIEDYARQTAAIEDLTARNAILVNTLADAMHRYDVDTDAWQMERAILQDQLKDDKHMAFYKEQFLNSDGQCTQLLQRLEGVQANYEEAMRQNAQLLDINSRLTDELHNANNVRAIMDSEIEELKDRNEQLLKACNDYYDTHLLPLNKKVEEINVELVKEKRANYVLNGDNVTMREQLDRQHSIMMALRAVFQLSKDASV